MEGIINIVKPPGMTSHDVISFLRRTLRIKKIGHCGTLDPQAAGVLPVCLGQATRLAEYLAGRDKSYYCEMLLGYETDTQDIWGRTIAEYPERDAGHEESREEIVKAMRSLEGEILQEIPAYSSVKHEGKSLHRYAREGRQITGMARKTRVASIALVDFGKGRIRFTVECGGGTYVRMLCRDIGRYLGAGGVMSFLLRLEAGPFRLENSVTLEEILMRMRDGEDSLREIVLPKELALGNLTRYTADSREGEKLRQGQAVWLRTESQGAAYGCKAWASGADGRLIAIGEGVPGSGSQSGSLLFRPDKTFV